MLTAGLMSIRWEERVGGSSKSVMKTCCSTAAGTVDGIYSLKSIAAGKTANPQIGGNRSSVMRAQGVLC